MMQIHIVLYVHACADLQIDHAAQLLYSCGFHLPVILVASILTMLNSVLCVT